MGKRKTSNRGKYSTPNDKVKDKDNKVKDRDNKVKDKDGNPTFNQHLLFIGLHLVLLSIMIYIVYNNPSHAHSGSLLVIKNGMNEGIELDLIEVNRKIYVTLDATLNRALSPYLQLWHSNGSKIKMVNFESLSSIRKLKHVYAGHFPNEWFVWPAVKINHRQTIISDDSRLIVKTISVKPAVFQIDNFLTLEECQELIRLAKPTMEPAWVIGPHKAKSFKYKSRNVSQTWLNNMNSSVVDNINQRIMWLLKVDIEFLNRDLQILHYSQNQYHHCHGDYIPGDPNITQYELGSQPPIVNRLYTVLIYLNQPEKGGETAFPRGGNWKVGDNYSCKSCANVSLKVEPRVGRLVFFYNLGSPPKHMLGIPDRNSLHMGCEIEKGEKWVAVRFGYNRPVNWREVPQFTG